MRLAFIYAVLTAGLLTLAGCPGDSPQKSAPEPKKEEAKKEETKPIAEPKKKEAGDYKVITVENGGSITGKVTWTGTRPKLDPYPINKNADVCDTGKTGSRRSNRLLIDKDGGVQNGVVFLTEISEGRALPDGPFVFEQEGCEYEPHILIVPKKAEVTLKSSDSVLHNVHMFGAANYNIPFPKPMELAKKLRKAGVVRLQCDAGHGWMTAYFHVVEHPYFAITEADGRFELEDVPPGKYTLNLWHEHWQVTDTTEKDGEVSTYTFADPVTQSQPIEVKAGEPTTADFSMTSST